MNRSNIISKYSAVVSQNIKDTVSDRTIYASKMFEKNSKDLTIFTNILAEKTEKLLYSQIITILKVFSMIPLSWINSKAIT